jgi:hypothetical protein
LISLLVLEMECKLRNLWCPRNEAPVFSCSNEQVLQHS